MSHLLVSGLTGFIYVPSRLSQGWEDCGGSCTPCGSTSGVYMLESTSSSGPGPCLAKLPRMSMNHEDRLIYRGMTRSSPNSHPVSKFWIHVGGHAGSPLFILCNSCSLLQCAKQFELLFFECISNWKEKSYFHVQQQFSGSHTLSLTDGSFVILLLRNLPKGSFHCTPQTCCVRCTGAAQCHLFWWIKIRSSCPLMINMSCQWRISDKDIEEKLLNICCVSFTLLSFMSGQPATWSALPFTSPILDVLTCTHTTGWNTSSQYQRILSRYGSRYACVNDGNGLR